MTMLNNSNEKINSCIYIQYIEQKTNIIYNIKREARALSHNLLTDDRHIHNMTGVTMYSGAKPSPDLV